MDTRSRVRILSLLVSYCIIYERILPAVTSDTLE